MKLKRETLTDQEIHSEKMRKLIKDIPKSISITGISVIILIIAAIISVLCLMPYPYSEGESIINHIIAL